MTEPTDITIFEKFIKNAPSWTLKEDIELKDVLQNLKNKILKSIAEIDKNSDSLDDQIVRLEIKLKNIHKQINHVKMDRFIKEDIDEIVIPTHQKREVLKETNICSKNDYEHQTIQTITSAVHEGFKLFDTIQPDIFALPDSDAPMDPSSSSTTKHQIQNPIKISHPCRLPPIIGTKEFNEFYLKISKDDNINEGDKIDQKRETDGVPAILFQNTTKEDDIQSTSSNRSVPPLDPILDNNQTANEVLKTSLLNITRIKKNLPQINSQIQKEKEQIEKVTTKTRLFSSSGSNSENENEQQDKHAPFISNQTKMASLIPINKNQNTGPLNISNQIFEVTMPDQANKQEQPVFLIKNIEAQSCKIETSQQRHPGITEIEQTKSIDKNEEDMSKPVLKTFDSTFSDRLSMAIQNGPVTLRPDRLLTRRPVSVHSISSNSDDGAPKAPPKPLRKTESSVSTNDELGPATVKARIAQIGAKIPFLKGGDDGGLERRIDKNKNTTIEQHDDLAAPVPPAQTKVLKTRVKGPATRRAPTHLRNNDSNIIINDSKSNKAANYSTLQNSSSSPPLLFETCKQPQKQEQTSEYCSTLCEPSIPTALLDQHQGDKKLPPVPPKQPYKGHSIFSSSSDDELLLSFSGKKSKQQVPLPSVVPKAILPASSLVHNRTVTQMKPSYTTKQPASISQQIDIGKKSKGLFSDSDSDF